MTAVGAVHRRHASQAFWSFVARALAAAAQMATVVVLARELPPSQFAHAIVIQTVLTIVTTVNSFGLNRKLSFQRSRDPEDPGQAVTAAQILFYTWCSVALFLLGTLLWFAIQQDSRILVLLPAAVWLYCEQVTQIWNGVSITDGRARSLIPSYMARRVPVVLVLIAAAVSEQNMYLALTSGMAIGGVMSVVVGYRSAPPWARRLRVRRRDLNRMRGASDMGIWFALLGDQIRDLDTTALTAVAPTTAGLYALPARLVRPMGMMSLAIATIAFPVFARKDRVTGRQVAIATFIGAMPTAVLAGLMFIFAPMVPRIAGPEFGASVSVLRVICVATALWAPSTILITFMQSRGKAAGSRFGILLIVLNVVMVIAIAFGGWADGPVAAATAGLSVQACTVVIIAHRVGAELRGHKRAGPTADQLI